MEFTFCRGRSIMSKYIRHRMLSEVNKCYGEKSRQDEAWKLWEGRGLSFTHGVWKGPIMVTFKQRCERFEGDSHVESIPGHIPCGPLGKSFQAEEEGSPEACCVHRLSGVRKESSTGRRAKRSWNPWLGGPDHCKGFSFYSE